MPLPRQPLDDGSLPRDVTSGSGDVPADPLEVTELALHRRYDVRAGVGNDGPGGLHAARGSASSPLALAITSSLVRPLATKAGLPETSGT